MRTVQMIAILGALNEEVELISKSLSDVSTIEEAGLSIVQGRLDDLSVVVTVAGMGTVNAGAATQHLITRYHPQALLFSGIAGSLNPELDIYDVVIGRDLHYLDTDIDFIAKSAPFTSVFHSDQQLVQLADEVLGVAGINYRVGVIASGDRFITGDRKADVLAQVPGADAVEMEGAAIAHICEKNAVPCLILRSMSDKADFADMNDGLEFDPSAYADVAASIVVEILKSLQ